MKTLLITSALGLLLAVSACAPEAPAPKAEPVITCPHNLKDKKATAGMSADDIKHCQEKAKQCKMKSKAKKADAAIKDSAKKADAAVKDAAK